MQSHHWQTQKVTRATSIRSREAQRWTVCLLILFAVVSVVSGTASAAKSRSRVHFDVAQLASCRASTWQSSRSQFDVGMQEKLVEASFDVSTLIRDGNEATVEELLFVIESPARSLQIVDFSPKTALTTRYAGNIERTQTSDETRSLGLNATVAPVQFGSAQGTASNGSSASHSTRFQLLPPQQLLAASGTIARGTAVFFKFANSPQSTLDGNRRLTVVFRVPDTWRADHVYLRCVAYERSSEPARPICGAADFLIPLYLDGDAAARAAANELAQHDLQLRRIASSVSSAANASNSWNNVVAAFIARKQQPKWPKNWLNQVLTSEPTQTSFAFQKEMPNEANEAIAAFTSARWHLTRLAAENVRVDRVWQVAGQAANRKTVTAEVSETKDNRVN